jgi:hypothetical protein
VIYIKAVLDVVLAVIAFVALVLDLGGERRRAYGGSFWQRLTHPGRAQVALGALVFVVLAGNAYIDLSGHITQAAEKRAAATTEQSRADTIDKLTGQVGPFVAMATERFPGLATDESLKRLVEYTIANEKQVSSLKGRIREQEDIRSHEVVARWGFDGMASFSGGVARIATPLVGWAAGRVKFDGKTVSFLCDNNGVEGYRRAIKREPRFPLPYCALAECLSRQGDPSWKDVAETGIAILEKTTKVPDHDPDHDAALKLLRKLMHDRL